MTKEKAVKRTAVSAPESIEEVARLISAIGRQQRFLAQIQADLNNEIERLKADALKKSQPRQQTIQELMERVYIFAESHRNELTDGGKTKTVHLPTGDVFWRMTPPSCLIRNVENVIAQCKALGLDNFIRVKEEPDKAAMLREPEVAAQIKGVKITQKEEFVVRPSEVEIEISQDTKKLKKVLKKRTAKSS